MLLSNREAATARLNCESHGVGFIPEMLLRTIITVPGAGVNEKHRSESGNMNSELGIRNATHPPELKEGGGFIRGGRQFLDRFVAFLRWNPVIAGFGRGGRVSCVALLYGVTMEEPGVSKVVSVRLENWAGSTILEFYQVTFDDRSGKARFVDSKPPARDLRNRDDGRSHR